MVALTRQVYKFETMPYQRRYIDIHWGIHWGDVKECFYPLTECETAECQLKRPTGIL